MTISDPILGPTSRLEGDWLDGARVLHVTEAFGGGVASALESYIDQTPTMVHGLAFSPAREAPAHDGTLDKFASWFDLGAGHRARTRAVQRAAEEFGADIIHAHSAYGGFYARALSPRRRPPIVYTPHGYSFLREDYSRLQRRAFRSIEGSLRSRTDVYAACSPYEALLSRGSVRRRPTVYVPNALRPESPRPVGTGGLTRGVTLVGIGRANLQKDPEFFAEAALAALRDGTASRAVWIGDGTARFRAPLEVAGVEILGWRSRDETRAFLGRPNTVLLHSARWEGFPIAVLEAWAAGAPMIVRDVPSFEGFDFPLVARTPGDVPSLLEEIFDERALAAATRALDATLAGNSWEVQGIRLRQAYAQALQLRSDRNPPA